MVINISTVPFLVYPTELSSKKNRVVNVNLYYTYIQIRGIKLKKLYKLIAE